MTTEHRRDAAEWQEHPANPDGWLVDPEAVLAWSETLEALDDDAALEWLRSLWRRAAARWRDGSGPTSLRLAAAAEMVQIEKEAARVPDRCRGGKCRSILEQCSRHSWEYQTRWGRAANE